MAGEEQDIVRLRNDFYKDGFYRMIIALFISGWVIAMLAGTSLYLYTHKPLPVTFYTDNDLRAFPLVPVTEPYVKPADLIQWVSEVLPNSFTFDFVGYQEHLKNLQQYYTPQGWAALTKLLDKYANIKQIETNKLFINAGASGTPTIPNQGLLENRYGWWIQLPLKIFYSSLEKRYDATVTIQALVVRIPTTNNLTGIAIDNIIEQPKAEAVPAQPDGSNATNG